MGFPEETITAQVITESGNLKPKHKKSESFNFSKSKHVFDKVIEEAIFIDGNAGELSHPDDIPWLDMSLVNSGMEIFHDYFAVYISSTILCMLTLGIAVKPISTLLFCTDKPIDVEKYFRRFLGKCRGVVKFFEVLLDPVEGKKIFYKTRKMHAIAVRRLENLGNGRTLPEMLIRTEEPWMQQTVDAIKLDVKELENKLNHNNEKVSREFLENLSWEAKVPFSQFGHVYFTAGFFGIVWMQPQLFGMKDRNDKRMKGFIHIWAIIVKMLGLRDEFNIYIKPNAQVIDRVVKEVYVYSLKTIDPVVIFLEKNVTEGINSHVPLYTVNGSLCLALKALGCEKMENIWKVISLRDKIMYYGINMLIYLGGTVTLARRFLNWGLKTLLNSLFLKVLGKHDKYS